MRTILLNDLSNPVDVEIRIPSLHQSYRYTHDEVSNYMLLEEFVHDVCSGLFEGVKFKMNRYHASGKSFVLSHTGVPSLRGMPLATVFIKIYDPCTGKEIVV